MTSLEELYPIPLAKVKDIFGEKCIDNQLPILNETFNYTERKWNENLKRLSQVKYVLLSEAPPHPENRDDIRYFYGIDDNREHIKRSIILSCVWKTFCKNKEKPVKGSDILDTLAEHGFLLLDTLPFAMKYTSRIRKTANYKCLVRICKDYLLEKINNRNIDWHDNVQLAIAFKLNGLVIIEAYPNGLIFPNNKVVILNKKMIVIGRNNYPSPEELIDLWNM